MFDFNNPINKNELEAKARETKAANDAAKGMLKMIMDVMLASDLPEGKKASLRIMRATQDIEDLVHDTASEAMLHDENINLDNAQKYLLMLVACHNQIKAFLESNPLISNTEATDESI